jgi:ABC-type Fe3+/spermidine/putrescine transport system ATPase subunit
VFPHLRVAENVRFGVGNGAGADESWIAELRDRLQLEPIWREPGHAISG